MKPGLCLRNQWTIDCPWKSHDETVGTRIRLLSRGEHGEDLEARRKQCSCKARTCYCQFAIRWKAVSPSWVRTPCRVSRDNRAGGNFFLALHSTNTDNSSNLLLYESIPSIFTDNPSNLLLYESIPSIFIDNPSNLLYTKAYRRFLHSQAVSLFPHSTSTPDNIMGSDDSSFPVLTRSNWERWFEELNLYFVSKEIDFSIKISGLFSFVLFASVLVFFWRINLVFFAFVGSFFWKDRFQPS